MMKCPICGYENREGARFCQGCGETLPGQTKPFAHNSASSPPTPLADTRPLPKVDALFAPLPEGALLLDGRYAILEQRGEDERMNVYLAEDTSPIRMCPSCQTEISDHDERFCSSCGADLSDTEPMYLRYIIRESADERAFATQAQLLRMRLEHPGLLLPRDVFSESPYGPPRRYLVELQFHPPLASTLAAPQRLNQVLRWGVSLAHALDHLHRHQVTLGDASLDHIVIEGKIARWAHLDEAYVLPPETRAQATNHLAQDVRGLATSLLYLATGQTQYSPQVALPEPVAAMFEHTLASPQGITDAAALGAALETTLQEIRRPGSFTHIIGRRTDVGQERSLNEDSMLTLTLAAVYRSASTPIAVCIVADGMGGHEAGDVASTQTIQAIARLAIEEVLASAAAGDSLPTAGDWLTEAVENANREVYDLRKAAGTDMGTTLVGALVVGDTATIANVGDSRAYLLGQEKIAQITTDHSLVERLVATGQITPAEAAEHPQRNVIYRVIGDKPRAEIDLFEQRLGSGEALLLCSDGLSGMVSDEQIWNIWKTSTSPQEASDRLVEAANEAGGEDNITVIVVQAAR